jgi:hypothetical protein
MLDAELVRLGMGTRKGLEHLLGCYPNQASVAQIGQLKACILGEGDYSPLELEGELWNLAETVRRVRTLPEGCYGPSDLVAELSAGRQVRD